MVSPFNCSQIDSAAVSDLSEYSVWGNNSLFPELRNPGLPRVKQFLNNRLLNPTLVGSNCTDYKSTSSLHDMKPSHSNHSKKIIKESLQQTHMIDKRGGDQLVRKHSPAVQRLDDIMTTRGKLVQYAMISTAGLMPSRIYTYNAKCEGMVTYGCGSSMEEAIEDAAAKFLEKFEFALVQGDDHLLNSMNSLKIKSNHNVSYNNHIGMLQEYCQARGLDLPKYEYHQDNDIKNKRYMYSVICSIGKCKCTGVGISKQIAKNHAARLMYIQIDSNNATINEHSTSNTRKKKPIDFGLGLSKNEAKNNTVNIALDQIYHGKNKTKMSANYIGTLQEKCAARGWELPKYEYHQENDNEIHKLFYSVICSAGPYKSTGVGNSKQLAKNQAAQIVCDQINLDQQNNTSVLHSNYAHDKADQFSQSNVMKLKNDDQCDRVYYMKIWYKQMSSSNKECVQKLKKCTSWEEINMTPIEFLTKLANEEDFNATYEQLFENVIGNTVFGAIHIYVARKYVMTFIDEGITDAEAQNSVAKKTLNYIKHTTLMI
ncbi:interferon-inducible double-stranded RNA-dependent protein kinase activator A [Acyrthosiphon pisum]|uniref:DRBM domain-containing protein n=1 Tax=Acyrthosiphon pisum TaxID=7029 RepID=A0A8R1W6P3_ACYPI|nr:interferon-inducible double-stranded RNA-dependent protein kinase activator A [Acyrthosiphon pisum]|eukprot:XP_003245358.1 PREDICTED: interferon-inducible double-stranded RNA-dependent protein kinase activator A-like [Acyrthosiphon pisum]